MSNKKEFKRGVASPKVIEKAQAFFEGTKAGEAICEGVSSGELIVSIRENYFNVYRNGCVLLEFKPRATKHKYLVHKKYWYDSKDESIDKSGENKLSLNLDDDQNIHTKQYIKEIIRTPNSNLKAYLDNKNKNGEGEKELLQAYLSAEKPCLIDLEVAFSCKNKKGNSKRGYVAKRVDLAVLEKSDSDVILRLIEAKVATDSRLKAEVKGPEVINQMNEYETFLREEHDNILESYKTIAGNYLNDFPYLIRQSKDKVLLQKFISNGGLDPMPSLLLMTKGKSVEEELKGSRGANNGNHYKTLKDECDSRGWAMIDWIKR